jgi:enoyl-CoA hydratase
MSLLVERSGSTLVMTINRPAARNAIDFATATALAAALDELDATRELRVGILTGAGGTFSAGMDLKAFLRGEPREVEGRGFGGLTDAPPAKPLIAAVEGYALAGGCEMVLACDLVTAAEDAAFGLPEVKRGLIAGSGGLLRLPGRIPPQIAMEYALTGDLLPAVEAHRWGLVNRHPAVPSRRRMSSPSGSPPTRRSRSARPNGWSRPIRRPGSCSASCSKSS